jgi:acetyltransferase-like isoleucine patch superfamily enzyme
VFAQRYDPSGRALGGQFAVHNGNGSGHGYPAVATAPDGSSLVVWHGGAIGRREILGQIFDSTGRRRGSQFVVNTRTDGDQSRPAVAAGGDGGFLAAWESSSGNGAREEVSGQFLRSSGARLGGELQLSTSDKGRPAHPAVAVGADGSAIVVWQTTFGRGGHPAVFARRFVSSADSGADRDGDGVPDLQDNCPTVANSDQSDAAADGFGDACVSPDAILAPDLQLGANPRIGAGTVIEPSVAIGDDAVIGEFVRVARGTRIGDRVALADFVSLGRRSSLGSDVAIGFATRFEGGIVIGDSVAIGDQVVVRRNVVIGDRAVVQPLVVLFAGARIGAGATIETGARVGRGAVVGPGAVVPAGTTVPPFTVVP